MKLSSQTVEYMMPDADGRDRYYTVTRVVRGIDFDAVEYQPVDGYVYRATVEGIVSLFGDQCTVSKSFYTFGSRTVTKWDLDCDADCPWILGM